MKLYGFTLALGVVFFWSNNICSQSTSYQVLEVSSLNSSRVYSVLDSRLKQDIQKYSGASKDETRALHTAYKARTRRIKDQIEGGTYFIDPYIQMRVDAICQRIFRANPKIPSEEIRVWVSRFPWPNASCLGEGTIVINIGLLTRLQNESQLAFVICHELAHYTQDHVNQALQNRIAFLYAKSTKKELKEISKSEYNRAQKIRELLGEVVYDDRKHGRENESEADFLALQYMSKANYDQKQALSTLKLLDEIDKEIETEVDLKAIFDSPDIPFQSHWLTKEESFMSGTKVKWWDTDSLKTHPDCQKRIQDLKPHINSSGLKDSEDENRSFRKWVKRCEFEFVEYYYETENFGRCIYSALQLLAIHPDNAYLHARIGVCLVYIWDAQKNHDRGKYLELPSSTNSDSFDSLITMLNRLRLTETEQLSLAYLRKHRQNHEKDEHFLFALLKTAQLMGLAEAEKLKSTYLSAYSDGQYLEFID